MYRAILLIVPYYGDVFVGVKMQESLEIGKIHAGLNIFCWAGIMNTRLQRSLSFHESPLCPRCESLCLPKCYLGASFSL